MQMQNEEERRGRLIRSLRERKLWTREQLAREAGVSITTVTDSEEARTQMRIGTATKLAEALGVDPLEILHPPLVELPIDIERVDRWIAETVKPQTPKEYREALDEAYARELAGYTQEELFEMKDGLLQEASRLADQQRGSREDIRRISDEDHAWRIKVIENANAVLRVLERAATRQEME